MIVGGIPLSYWHILISEVPLEVATMGTSKKRKKTSKKEVTVSGADVLYKKVISSAPLF
jgi:hypothetical protein